MIAGVVAAGCTGSSATDDDGSGATDRPGASGDTAPAPPTAVDTSAVEGAGTRPPPSGTAAPGAGVDDTDGAVGVPGLDSDEAICRAWSRWAGSYQVLLVWATFGDGDPVATARLEVLAAPVVTEAARELVALLPPDLDDEAEAVAEGYLGPYTRRSARALDALESAGADTGAIAAISESWLATLAERDPAVVAVVVDLDPDLEPLVADAARAFDAQLVPIPLDPSLVLDVEVPRTERFLAETCPDGGELAGSEVQT